MEVEKSPEAAEEIVQGEARDLSGTPKRKVQEEARDPPGTPKRKDHRECPPEVLEEPHPLQYR